MGPGVTLQTVLVTSPRCVVFCRSEPAAAVGQRRGAAEPAAPARAAPPAQRAHRAAAAAAEAAAPEDPDGEGADQDAAGGATATGDTSDAALFCSRGFSSMRPRFYRVQLVALLLYGKINCCFR